MTLRIEELEVASYLAELEDYLGQKSLPSRLGVFLDTLPDSLNSAVVRELVDGSGDDCWILDFAEKLCRDSDSNGFETSIPGHLESLASSITITGQVHGKAELPIGVKDADYCLPGQEDRSTVDEMMEAMVVDAGKLPGDVSHDQFFAAFDSLFDNYCSSIPSRSTGVSLYQRAKTKCAMASCIYLYAEENGLGPHDIEGSSPFVIISGDASGIQKYIFGVETYKNSTKLIRARSFQVWIQSFLIAGAICRRIGVGNSNIVSFSGGKFLLLLPNLARLEEVLAEVSMEMDMLCIDVYSGEISFVISPGIVCSCHDMMASRADELQKRIRLAGTSAKQKKLQHGISARKSGAVLEEQYRRLQSAGAICPACGSNPADGEDGFCRECSYLVELGRLLNKEGFYIELSFDEIGPLEKMVKIHKSGKGGTGSIVYSMTAYRPGFPRLSLPYYVPVDGRSGEVMTLEDLASYAKGVRKLAMFKADVDCLGFIFSASLGERWSLARYASLSALFHFYFSETLVSLIKGHYPGIYVVFSGGDDVCVLGSWDSILSFADDFSASFSTFSAGNPSLTISAGIAMFNPHDPIPVVAEWAEEALEESKGMIGKNHITLFSRSLTWDEYSKQLRNASILSKMDELSKSGFLYRILEYSDNAYSLAKGEIELNDIRKALWLSHYSYSLRRAGIKDDDVIAVLRSYTNPEEMSKAKVAVTISKYKGREVRSELSV